MQPRIHHGSRLDRLERAEIITGRWAMGSVLGGAIGLAIDTMGIEPMPMMQESPKSIIAYALITGTGFVFGRGKLE